MNSSQACLVCPYCNAGCKSSSDLARHLFEKHPLGGATPPAFQQSARFDFDQDRQLPTQENPFYETSATADHSPRGTSGEACQCPECMAGWPSTVLPSPQYPQPPPNPGFYPGYPGFFWPYAQTTGQQQATNRPPLAPLPSPPNAPYFVPPYTFGPLPAPAPVPAPRNWGRFVGPQRPAPPAATVMQPNAYTSDPTVAVGIIGDSSAEAQGSLASQFDAPTPELNSGAQPLRLAVPSFPRPMPRTPPRAPAPPQPTESECDLLNLLKKAPFRWGDFSDSPGAFPLVEQQPDEATLAELQVQLRRLKSWSEKRLWVFGSLVQNLGSRRSDLDLCVEPVPKQSHAATLQAIATKLRKNGFTRFEAVLHARVPVLRSLPSAPVQFDISVASEGLRNSWLVRAYVLSNPDLVYPLTSTIVTALKHCGLHGNRSQCLSSFAVVVMVLHFLLWRGRISFIQPPAQLAFHEYKAFPAHQPLSPPKDPEAVRALLVDCLRFYSGPEGKTTPSEPEKLTEEETGGDRTAPAASEALSAETRYFPAERFAVRLAPRPWAYTLARAAACEQKSPLAVLDPVQPELDAARSLSRDNWQQTCQVFRWIASLAEAHAGSVE